MAAKKEPKVKGYGDLSVSEAWKEISNPVLYDVEIAGVGGLMQNKQPDFSQVETEKKKQSSKSKAEEERENWRDRLYYTEELGVHIPGEVLHACLESGAQYWGKKVPGEGSRTFTQIIKRGAIAFDMPLGNGKKMERDDPSIVPFGKNVNGSPTKAGRAIVYRIRPLIRPWGGIFQVMVYDTRRITKDVLGLIVQMAGLFSGIGDWRPNYGRFELVEMKEAKGMRNAAD